MCVAECGHLATSRHVIMGECRGCVDRAAYVKRMRMKMEQLERLIPNDKLTKATPVREWCQCRTAVRRAVRAFQAAEQDEVVDDADWDAVERVLGGILPRCRAAEGMKTEKRRHLESRIVRLMIEMQDVVVASKQARAQQNREARGLAGEEDRVRWRDNLAERARRGRLVGLLGTWAIKTLEPRRSELRAEAVRETSALKQKRVAVQLQE